MKPRKPASPPPISGCDVFGSTDPRKMPTYLFAGALAKHFDTAIRADLSKQNYLVCPRHWYFDAEFKCAKCDRSFLWSAAEQRTWFEHYRFWIDSQPRHCRDCQAKNRHLLALRKEYDLQIEAARTQGSREMKQRLICIIDELEAAFGSIPKRMIETRALFHAQSGKE